jgi:hypothetical protein
MFVIAFVWGVERPRIGIYQRRVGKPADALRATALQMLAGGAMIGVEAAITGEWRVLDLHAIRQASLLLGFAWLLRESGGVGDPRLCAVRETAHGAALMPWPGRLHLHHPACRIADDSAAAWTR